MAEYLTALGLDEFLKTHKGAGWLSSRAVKDEAIDYYASHMVMSAWRAVHGKFLTPAYIHCRKTIPRDVSDIAYWSMTKAPLLPREVVEVYQVEIFRITPSGIRGRFDIIFNHKLPGDERGKWMKLKNVPYQSFDPFLQFWLLKLTMSRSAPYSSGVATDEVKE